MFLRIRPNSRATWHQAFVRDFLCCMDQLAVVSVGEAFENWYPVRILRRWRSIVFRDPSYKGADWFPDYL